MYNGDFCHAVTDGNSYVTWHGNVPVTTLPVETVMHKCNRTTNCSHMLNTVWRRKCFFTFRDNKGFVLFLPEGLNDSEVSVWNCSMRQKVVASGSAAVQKVQLCHLDSHHKTKVCSS